MARNIFIVNATQVVTSETHPEGIYSVISGFPKIFDSQNYTDIESALRAAKAEYFSRLSANYVGSANRVMAATTLSQADGRLIMHECIGSFPYVQPVVEPEDGETPEEENVE